MAKIDIRRPHSLSLAQARKEASVMAEHLKEEFGLESSWSGNALKFKRSGVSGSMNVDEEAVHVAAELGFLVALLKPKIEARLHAHFDDVFGSDGKKKAAAKKAASAGAAAKAPAKKAAAAKKTAR